MAGVKAVDDTMSNIGPLAFSNAREPASPRARESREPVGECTQTWDSPEVRLHSPMDRNGPLYCRLTYTPTKLCVE